MSTPSITTTINKPYGRPDAEANGINLQFTYEGVNITQKLNMGEAMRLVSGIAQLIKAQRLSALEVQAEAIEGLTGQDT